MTVAWLMPRERAICLLANPWRSRLSTWASRGVSSTFVRSVGLLSVREESNERAALGCSGDSPRAAARTPVVVIELIALPVSYTLAFPAHRIEYGAPILVSALVVLYLLFTPATRAALDREP